MRKKLLFIALASVCAFLIGFTVIGYGVAAPIKHFEGIKIRFFCGGPPGCPYATVLYNGARAAEKDLGCKVDYIWSDWNPRIMIEQFKEALSARVDGIVVMGHPGHDPFKPLIDRAFDKGIIVTTIDTPLPKLEASYNTKGFGYIGEELYPHGYALGKECIRRFNLKKGDRALVWGLLAQEVRGLRSKGAIDVLKEAGLVVDYIEISSDVDADPSLGTPVLTGYIASHPDIKLIVADHGGLTATLGTYLKVAGKGPDDIYAVGFDLTAATVAAIRNGYCDLVTEAQPYLQGYLAILQICMTKKYGFAGLHIDTGVGFIDASNVKFVAELAKKGIR